MTLPEIKNMLNILMEYEDCDITHTVPGILNLFYSKSSQTFEITIFSTGEVVDCCNRDEACEILHKIITLFQNKV